MYSGQSDRLRLRAGSESPSVNVTTSTKVDSNSGKYQIPGVSALHARCLDLFAAGSCFAPVAIAVLRNSVQNAIVNPLEAFSTRD